jgi:aspartyl-tRNA(Asn)/glutamyl-tRNA(Gln) amidotransferase subunit A
MTELTHLTISEALEGLNKKEFTSQELTTAHIEACESVRDLNAFVTFTPDIALNQAKASDRRRAKGMAGPIEGIPLAIKDLFCTKGVQTTASSHILEGFIPRYESTVTSRLFRDGAVMLGKTSMDEFAMGSSNTSSHYGNVINPWRSKASPATDLVPGGSSGGSASIVAARAAMGATGTDTGGSIRQPASFCGITGIKPTYGRCSRWGIVAFGSSLDQAGVFARNVRDCAILLRSASGYDSKDSTSANMPVPDFSASLKGDVKGLRIGIPKEYRVEGMPHEIDEMWQNGIDLLKDAGAEIVDISLPRTKYALPVYYIVAPAEASSNLARYDGVRYGRRIEGENLIDMYERTRAEGFGEEVKRRIMIGTYVLSAGYYDAYYVKAQKVRRLIKQDFLDAYEKCDALLTPTAPSAAFAIGENEDDPIKMYLNDVFTVSVNLAGLPGLSLPAGLNSDGLPLGLQIIGRHWDEETVFRVSDTLEKAINFNAMPQIISEKAA